MNPWMCDEPEHLELQTSVICVQHSSQLLHLVRLSSPNPLNYAAKTTENHTELCLK